MALSLTNTFVISSATSIGDQVTVVGSVNGVDVTVSVWLSHLQQLNKSGPAAVQNYIASQMLQAGPPQPTPVDVALLPTGTFTATVG